MNADATRRVGTTRRPRKLAVKPRSTDPPRKMSRTCHLDVQHLTDDLTQLIFTTDTTEHSWHRPSSRALMIAKPATLPVHHSVLCPLACILDEAYDTELPGLLLDNHNLVESQNQQWNRSNPCVRVALLSPENNCPSSGNSKNRPDLIHFLGRQYQYDIGFSSRQVPSSVIEILAQTRKLPSPWISIL